jgi:Tfp pilus assembly protein PilF
MSLISDALRTKQREASARSAGEAQPLLDGFFPYVSGDARRPRRRLMPILVIGGVGAALLAVTAFLILSKPEKGTPTVKRPPIVLPPPVTVAQTPVVDSALVRASTQTSDPIPQEEAGPAVGSEPRRPARGATPPAAGVRGSAVVTAGETPARTQTDAPVSSNASIPRVPAARSAGTTTTVDYEAQATMAFNAGDLAGAREKFQLATRYAPTARAWTNYGVTLQRLGDNAGAASAYQAAMGIDANYLEAWLYQGRLASDMGDVGRAIPLFLRARAINPRHADVNIELARLEYDARNWSEARRFAEEATRGDPANARGHWYVAVASDQLKDSDAALRAYSAYLQAVSGAERGQEQFVGYARERIALLKGRP